MREPGDRDREPHSSHDAIELRSPRRDPPASLFSDRHRAPGRATRAPTAPAECSPEARRVRRRHVATRLERAQRNFAPLPAHFPDSDKPDPHPSVTTK